jgi:hypothetical protein
LVKSCEYIYDNSSPIWNYQAVIAVFCVQEKHLQSQKPYQCPKCEFKSPKISVFLSHYRGHSASLACHSCSHVADSLAMLKKHRRSHVEPARHVCVTCLKVFSHHTTLEQHQAVHSNEKKFKCRQCTFSSKYRYCGLYYLVRYLNSKYKNGTVSVP